MKPASYWEEKLSEAVKTHVLLEDQIWRVDGRSSGGRKDECSYIRRKRWKVARTKLAGLERKLQALKLRMEYFNERLRACAEITRFDRTRRLPPI